MSDFDMAVRLAPDDSKVHAIRGDNLARSANLDRALADYNRAMELDGKAAGPYVGRGAVYQAKKDLDNSARRL